MSAVIYDSLTGAITSGVANSVVNAGGRLLKLIELQQRYGKLETDSGEKTLSLLPLERQEKES